MAPLHPPITPRALVALLALTAATLGAVVPAPAHPAPAGPAAGAPAGPAPAAPAVATDHRFDVTAETKGEAVDMTYWLGDDAARFDTGDRVSVIWISGEEPRMYVVQHAEKRFMVWGAEQFEMIRRMMERMPSGMMPGAGEEDDDEIDLSNLSFVRTGNREQIGDWEAFEVQVQGLADGRAGAVWLTEDLEIGLMEVFARTIELMDTMKLPAMMTGEGRGVDNPVERFRALARASGLPDGRAVRIVNTDDGETTVMTLRGVGAGPFSFDPFGAPGDDYEEMRMPTVPR